MTPLRPATLIGSGAVERWRELIADEAIGLVIVDGALSPVQQRNLEQAWKCKVIDRTGLILEIFGERARTREGQLQVELAALDLSAQPAGAVLDPPGAPARRLRLPRRPRRIAARNRPPPDRRAHRHASSATSRTCKRTRGLHREARKRVPYPVVALVGYTNAGKSTLFNRLTRADVHGQGPAVRDARSDHARGRSCRRAARSSCPTRSASSPICRPTWSPPSAPRWKR